MSSHPISRRSTLVNQHVISRQAGGTLKGLLIGLIIGLSIAVWVADTIMKTPVPFIDKLGKQSEKTGEMDDPNSTLPGGARYKHVKPADVEAAPDVAEVPVLPAVPPKKVPQPADITDSIKPAATDKSKAEKNSPTAVPGSPASPSDAAADEKFTYYLQAGAFREIADAEASKAKLALMGVAATISERRSELGSLYRVRIGPYAEVESMNRIRTRLSDNGVDAAVVRVPK